MTVAVEPRMSIVTITLPDSLSDFVATQIATKGYGDVSDYFRTLLAEAQAREEEARLEALLLEGLASERIPFDDDFRKALDAEAETIVAKYQDQPRS